MGSDRSCTRNRLMPIEVRLPVGRRGHTQAVQRSAPPRQCSPPRNGFSPDASVGHSARSVAPVQTCAPRLSDSATGVVLWRKAQPVTAVCSRFAPLPHVSRSRFFAAAVPLHTVPQRHVSCAHRQHSPIPGLRSPRAAEPLHPSFSLSFPCPNFFFRGCC